MESRFPVTGLIMILIMSLLVPIFSLTEHAANAQKFMTFGDSNKGGNKTSGAGAKLINGTINLDETIFKAIGAKVNTSLTKAITTAEQTVGNKSFALAAFGGPVGSYLVYTVILASPTMKFHKVIVDPGTGKILDSEEISQQEMHMFMHGMGHNDQGMMMMGSDGPMKPGGNWN